MQKRVLKFKLHANATVERYKEQLFAKGFTQTEWLDYMDTLNPMVKMTKIQVLISIAVVHR